MPWSAPEATANEKGSNEDGNGKSNKSGNSGNAEDGTNRNSAGKYEKCQTNANDCIKPHRINWGLSMSVDLLPDSREGKAVITSVGVCDSRGSNHVSLSHREATDDSQAKNRQSRLLWHNLQQVRSPRLTQVTLDDGIDIDNGVSSDELEKPSKQASELFVVRLV